MKPSHTLDAWLPTNSAISRFAPIKGIAQINAWCAAARNLLLASTICAKTVALDRNSEQAFARAQLMSFSLSSLIVRKKQTFYHLIGRRGVMTEAWNQTPFARNAKMKEIPAAQMVYVPFAVLSKQFAPNANITTRAFILVTFGLRKPFPPVFASSLTFAFWYRNNSLLPKKLLQMVAEMHIKVRHELKNGRYDWFRPLYGTSIQNEMVKANRELQMMIDNGSILRGSNQTKHSKEGRILTFQANLPITIQLSAQEKIYESVDKKGSPFVEYDYNDGGNSNQDRIEWVKNNPNKYR